MISCPPPPSPTTSPSPCTDLFPLALSTPLLWAVNKVLGPAVLRQSWHRGMYYLAPLPTKRILPLGGQCSWSWCPGLSKSFAFLLFLSNSSSFILFLLFLFVSLRQQIKQLKIFKQPKLWLISLKAVHVIHWEQANRNPRVSRHLT